MTASDPVIHTGIVREAIAHLKAECERQPTTEKPWDASVILGILRALPDTVRQSTAFHVVRTILKRPALFETDLGSQLAREARLMTYSRSEAAGKDFVSFGDLARVELGTQCQYASRFIGGVPGQYPDLAHGLRIRGERRNYHGIYIHVDDIPTFTSRYREFRSYNR